ncbi:MAG: hypothetical protein HY644_14815 [Acidobacteria bacterium]|nr:hypothetical protein [Acidobacteriota bacterium]
MLKRELRLGDTVDDYCIRCRLITGHAVVTIVERKAGKVRCETCYFEHNFGHGGGARHQTSRVGKKDKEKERPLE